MTPLRQKLIDEIQLRGFSINTQDSYERCVNGLARFYHRSPDQIADDEIKAYLVARYGDFVLYDPPVKPLTWVLWFGPFALAIGGGAVWWLVLKRRAKMAPQATDIDAQTRGRKLLDDEDES